MTHKSLFKEAAQQLVQRGQMSESPVGLQTQADVPAQAVRSQGGLQQMNAGPFTGGQSAAGSGQQHKRA